jgi:single-strand DNA-binding protein
LIKLTVSPLRLRSLWWRSLHWHVRAIGYAERFACHVRAALRFAHLEICARPSSSVREGRAENSCAVMKSKAQHALPDDGKRAQQKEMEVTAMAINKVIVIGNLGANPDIRALPSGQNVANFSLATTERFTDRNGAKQERTEWHRIVAFGRLADTCQRFLSKGRQVYIEGRLTTRQYEAKDGSGKRFRTEIVARQLRLLGNRANTPKAQASDEIPF